MRWEHIARREGDGSVGSLISALKIKCSTKNLVEAREV